MATHSSNLAWKIPWTEESGELQSMGLQRVGHSSCVEQMSTTMYSVLLCVCVCVCVCAHHIFFIHSTVDGHLGYFHVLAVIKISARNTVEDVSSNLHFPRYVPRSGIADHVVTLFLVF